MMLASHFIIPIWPAPKQVRAYTSTRSGGLSTGIYANANFSEKSGDALSIVRANQQWLKNTLALPSDPCWLNQIHGNTVLLLEDGIQAAQEPTADASVTDKQGIVAVVRTADCLPLLLCNADGTRVAAVHAGWKGLAAGVIESALHAFSKNDRIHAWLGPAIGPDFFVVGEAVYNAFTQTDKEAKIAFKPTQEKHKWYCNLYTLASQRLRRQDVNSIHGGTFCTYRDSARFYSYRRDGALSGRMATCIWIDSTS